METNRLTRPVRCKSIVHGSATGPLLYSDLGLSFMGGVDPTNGMVIDVHHPLHGHSLAGKILAIPGGRGSCSGSLAIFELLNNGHAPAALIFKRKETILSLGVFIATELLSRGIPVVQVEEDQFHALASSGFASISGDTLTLSSSPLAAIPSTADLAPLNLSGFDLTASDQQTLDGERGEAARVAMHLILRTAELEGATALVVSVVI